MKKGTLRDGRLYGAIQPEDAEHPLVEKMADAIFEALEGYAHRAELLRAARAALKVVAEWEPSEGMMSDETDVAVGCCVPNASEKRDFHRAMMSALKREAGLS